MVIRTKDIAESAYFIIVICPGDSCDIIFIFSNSAAIIIHLCELSGAIYLFRYKAVKLIINIVYIGAVTICGLGKITVACGIGIGRKGGRANLYRLLITPAIIGYGINVAAS